DELNSLCVIWAAGISGNTVKGLSSRSVLPNGRIIVNDLNEVKWVKDVYAIGDISIHMSPENPNGHPQVAPVAIQQAENLAKNLNRSLKNKAFQSFKYIDKGSMATVGRNKAVVELSFLKFGGTMAWLTWMFVHLMSIIGIKNRIFILINWLYNYFTFNLSLRLILKERK
ncbi:MAG: FAD-dependent oxidoreductase, partial [Bacteroidales bacterium]